MKYKIDENGHAVIPDSVTEIGICAFDGCTRLTDVFIQFKRPDMAKNVLCMFDCRSQITLHVPIGTGYAYRHSGVAEGFKAVVADGNSAGKKAPKSEKVRY